MTGGIGRERLTNFYRHHFIFSNSDDTELELVSRTVGIDRIVDEFVFCFTHNRQIDWMSVEAAFCIVSVTDMLAAYPEFLLLASTYECPSPLWSTFVVTDSITNT